MFNAGVGAYNWTNDADAPRELTQGVAGVIEWRLSVWDHSTRCGTRAELDFRPIRENGRTAVTEPLLPPHFFLNLDQRFLADVDQAAARAIKVEDDEDPPS